MHAVLQALAQAKVSDLDTADLLTMAEHLQQQLQPSDLCKSEATLHASPCDNTHLPPPLPIPPTEYKFATETVRRNCLYQNIVDVVTRP